MNLNLNTKKNAFVRAFTLTISHLKLDFLKSPGKSIQNTAKHLSPKFLTQIYFLPI